MFDAGEKLLNARLPRILVVAVWFGPLPAWFPLWAASCGRNPDITWLLVTDDAVDPLQIPSNVVIRMSTLQELRVRLEDFAGMSITLDRPYKLCDYKPLYSCLLELVPGEWDFWGHCDMDVIFGNIQSYLALIELQDYDRLFGLGHFSLYRNTPHVNTSYKLPYPGESFQVVSAHSAIYGFDEHHGVNAIWRHHGLRFFEKEEWVADIDPHVMQMTNQGTGRNYKNFRCQVFGYFDGRVVKRAHTSTGWREQEFMYIHFQKRPMTKIQVSSSSEAFWFSPDGFIPSSGPEISRVQAKTLNPRNPVWNRAELSHRLRRLYRTVRRRGVL